MPAIISCMVGKRICENPKDDHWSVRDFAARLMALVCQRYGKSYHTMQPRITKTLLHAFLDVKKPITTHYGAIVGLSQLGREVIRTVILPNAKAYADSILREPLQADGTIRQLEASKCRNALTVGISFILDQQQADVQMKLTSYFLILGFTTYID
jgi:transcription initiation factor TFIID subunit 6